MKQLTPAIQIDKADETVQLIEDNGGNAKSISVDVTSGADNDAMAELAVSQFGGLDCLVTAAGISHANYVSGDIEPDIKNIVENRATYLERPGWEFVEADPDSFDKVLNVNLKGTLLGMQSCAAQMLESGTRGSIVTIASIAAKHPDAGPVAYTVSKAGVWMLTKKVARMLGPVGIRVNSIGPGFIKTHMTAVIDLMDESEAVSILPERQPPVAERLSRNKLGPPTGFPAGSRQKIRHQDPPSPANGAPPSGVQCC